MYVARKPLPAEYKPDIPPFAHQREALEAGWWRQGFGYLLEMGLGKTRVTIDDFCLNYQLGLCDALLVIAPKPVYSNWARWSDDDPGELQKWLWKDVKDGLVLYQYRAGKYKRDEQLRVAALDRVAPGPRIVVMNIEALSSTDQAVNFAMQFLKAHKTMIAIDESTIIKDRKSIRTKVCLKLKQLATFRRILTGSPSTGSPSDVWSQFEFLETAALGHRHFATFQARYCELREIRVAGGRTIKSEVGSKNLEELRDLLKRHSIRKRKSECLDLPAKVYAPLYEVEMTEEQARAYKDMKTSAMAVINGQEVTTQIVVTQLMRLHQIACGHVTTDDGTVLRLKNRRTDALLDVLATSGSRQAIVWCNYRADIDAVTEAIAAKYGRESVSHWHGGLNQDEREAGEADFQNGRTRFMIATQSSGARGRTWTAANLVVYYSNSYDLELREQSEDRAHRIGQTGTVTYVDLACPGTVDEKIIQALRKKKDVVRTVLQDGISQWI